MSSELYPTKGVSTHFRAANNALAEAMSSNVSFASSMEDLKIIVPRTKTGIVSPGKIPNWVWHHSTEPGVMQLVPQAQHTNGSIFWNTLHPRGRGGMSLWGGGYRR
ncbi:MAG: HNH endonuclease [Flavobacterium sp.]